MKWGEWGVFIVCGCILFAFADAMDSTVAAWAFGASFGVFFERRVSACERGEVSP
jgi:hypothetical protein